jgi:hypothetical protein
LLAPYCIYYSFKILYMACRIQILCSTCLDLRMRSEPSPARERILYISLLFDLSLCHNLPITQKDALQIQRKVRAQVQNKIPWLPEGIQTLYQSTTSIMSKQPDIPGDESQEVGHCSSRSLLSGSTINAPVTINSYTNYGQHVESGGRIDNHGGK